MESPFSGISTEKNLLSIFSCILHNGSFHRVITGLDENESSCLKLGSSFGFENMNGCCNTYLYYTYLLRWTVEYFPGQ